MEPRIPAGSSRQPPEYIPHYQAEARPFALPCVVESPQPAQRIRNGEYVVHRLHVPALLSQEVECYESTREGLAVKKPTDQFINASSPLVREYALGKKTLLLTRTRDRATPPPSSPRRSSARLIPLFPTSTHCQRGGHPNPEPPIFDRPGTALSFLPGGSGGKPNRLRPRRFPGSTTLPTDATTLSAVDSLDGVPLAVQVDQHGALPTAEALRFFEALAHAGRSAENGTYTRRPQAHQSLPEATGNAGSASPKPKGTLEAVLSDTVFLAAPKPLVGHPRHAAHGHTRRSPSGGHKKENGATPRIGSDHRGCRRGRSVLSEHETHAVNEWLIAGRSSSVQY